MRELTVRIRFTSPSLGDQKLRDGTGRFVFQRGPGGQILFLASWHLANVCLAAQLLNRHQEEVRNIFWDINLDGRLRRDPWYRNWYQISASGRKRYSLHEAFFTGQVVGINCAVPQAIDDGDFWRLMTKAGTYRGLSPWHPGEFGKFEVVSIRPRQAPRRYLEDQIVRVEQVPGVPRKVPA